MNMRFLRAWWPALIGSIFFVTLALLLIPYPGLQEDELDFAPAVFHPEWNDHISIGRHMIPRMLTTYLGATKTWLYVLIFKLWRPSIYSTRVPAILIYAVTIWIFYAVLRNVHSRRAGAVGALLLATDPTYVLAGSFGWCNLQNALMLASIAAFLKFYETTNRLWLAAAAFFTGLWLWDKVLGIWMLSGLVLAVTIVFPREALRRVNWKNAAVGLAAFCVGAFPLILYNVENQYPTLRSNAHFSTVRFREKVAVLESTANGSAWFGTVVSEPGIENPRIPQTLIGKWTVALHDRTGDRRYEYLPYAFGASLLLLPVLLTWRRYSAVRLLLFSLIVMSVAWSQMAFAEGAGMAGHHVALMWPFPHLFIAVALTEVCSRWRAGGRWLLAAAVVILMAANLLTLNQYLYQFVRFGGAKGWSDAIFALSRQMPGFKADQIFIPDWGIIGPLTTLSKGRLPVRWEGEALLSDQASAAAESEVLATFAAKNSIWVTHTAENEMFAGANARLDKMVSAAGYQRMELRQVRDQNHVAVFDVFRIVPRPISMLGPMLPSDAMLGAARTTP
jgi:4-amino-4-deoxy-L-arabinose transferase-like glycosyltransferase